MTPLFARAQDADPNANIVLVLIAIGIAAAVSLLAAIPVVIARRRGRNIEGIVALMVLWSVLAGGSLIYFATAQIRYSQEYTIRIMQNYDASDQTDRPTMPWKSWAFLGIAYGGMLLWAATAKSAPARGFPMNQVRPPDDPSISRKP